MKISTGGSPTFQDRLAGAKNLWCLTLFYQYVASPRAIWCKIFKRHLKIFKFLHEGYIYIRGNIF